MERATWKHTSPRVEQRANGDLLCDLELNPVLCASLDCGQGQAFYRLAGCQQKESPGIGGYEEQLFHINLLFIERLYRKPSGSATPGSSLGKASHCPQLPRNL